MSTRLLRISVPRWHRYLELWYRYPKQIKTEEEHTVILCTDKCVGLVVFTIFQVWPLPPHLSRQTTAGRDSAVVSLSHTVLLARLVVVGKQFWSLYMTISYNNILAKTCPWAIIGILPIGCFPPLVISLALQEVSRSTAALLMVTLKRLTKRPAYCRMIVSLFKDRSLGQLISLWATYINRFSHSSTHVVWVFYSKDYVCMFQCFTINRVFKLTLRHFISQHGGSAWQRTHSSCFKEPLFGLY